MAAFAVFLLEALVGFVWFLNAGSLLLIFRDDFGIVCGCGCVSGWVYTTRVGGG